MKPPSFALALLVVLSAAPALAQHAAHPTPHQLLDEALRPVSDQLRQLQPTDAERHDVDDVLTRADVVAADLVAAQHRGDNGLAQALSRRIDLFARLVRGRIEASRAEGQAAESERLALDADARRVQARAALERAAERRLEVDRAAGVSASGSPAPSGSGGAR